MTSKIINKSIDMIKKNFVVFIIAAAIYAVAKQLVSGSTGIMALIMGLLGTVVTISSACFYFRGYNRGEPNLSDMYLIFTYPGSVSKLVSVFLAIWIISAGGAILARFFILMPLISALITLAVLVITFLLSLAVYLVVANPDYPTEYYLKASARYLGGHWLGFIGFVILIAIVPAIIEAFVAMILGNTISLLVSIPLNAFVDLCVAGYVSEQLIPDEWYAGYRSF